MMTSRGNTGPKDRNVWGLEAGSQDAAETSPRSRGEGRAHREVSGTHRLGRTVQAQAAVLLEGLQHMAGP